LLENAAEWYEDITIWCDHGTFYVREKSPFKVQGLEGKITTPDLSEMPEGTDVDKNFIRAIQGLEPSPPRQLMAFRTERAYGSRLESGAAGREAHSRRSRFIGGRRRHTNTVGLMLRPCSIMVMIGRHDRDRNSVFAGPSETKAVCGNFSLNHSAFAIRTTVEADNWRPSGAMRIFMVLLAVILFLPWMLRLGEVGTQWGENQPSGALTQPATTRL